MQVEWKGVVKLKHKVSPTSDIFDKLWRHKLIAFDCSNSKFADVIIPLSGPAPLFLCLQAKNYTTTTVSSRIIL